MKLCGIYSISFIDKDKIYIGSSNDICRRGAEHLNFLKQNKHCNNKLQNAFNKYGIENFKFEILDTIEYTTHKELIKLEQEYLDIFVKASTDLSFFKQKSYNISTITNGSKGFNNKNNKKVSVFNLNMEFIEELPSVRETERKYNVNGAVHKICKGIRQQAKGFIFRYSDNLNITFNNKKKLGWRKGEKRKHVLPIYQYNLDGSFIKEWRCIEEASKELKIYSGGINRNIKGEYKSIKNFIFKTKKENNNELSRN